MGTWIFLDANTKQQPVILGTLLGKPSSLADTTKGFNDPNGKYPLEINQPDIDKLARGENTIDKSTESNKGCDNCKFIDNMERTR